MLFEIDTESLKIEKVGTLRDFQQCTKIIWNIQCMATAMNEIKKK